MSERPVTNFEWTVAALTVEAIWNASREDAQARERLLALEMVVQGLAVIRGIPAEEVREALSRCGYLAEMPPLGNA